MFTDNNFISTPSEAFYRMNALIQKMEYEKLDEEEEQELEYLKSVCNDSFDDFQKDFMGLN